METTFFQMTGLGDSYFAYGAWKISGAVSVRAHQLLTAEVQLHWLMLTAEVQLHWLMELHLFLYHQNVQMVPAPMQLLCWRQNVRPIPRVSVVSLMGLTCLPQMIHEEEM